MRVGVVFSQADSGTDHEAIRDRGRAAEAAGFSMVACTSVRSRRQVEEAVELGFDRPSIGYDRLAHPGAPHAAHLDAVVAVEAELDSIVAGRGARVMSAILIPNC